MPFEKKHKKSVGNKGRTDYPRKQAEKRFISAAVEDSLRRRIEGGKNPSTYLKRIADRLVDTAANAKKPADRLAAAKEIMDRLEGKPAQALEITGKDKGPIQMITKQMTDAEAARIYQATLRRFEEDDD